MREDFTQNHKLFYRTLKQLREKKTYTMRSIKDKNGKILTEEREMMKGWRQYFEELTQTDQVEEMVENLNGKMTKQRTPANINCSE